MRLLKNHVTLFAILALLATLGFALAIYVQNNTSSISDALAAEVLEQQSDVAVLLHEYDRLLLALGSERYEGGDRASEEVLDALVRTEQQLEEMRFNYSFERLDGAATAHAYVKPVLEDVREWLTEGIPGIAPDRQRVIAAASARLQARHDNLRVITTETYEVASQLVNKQANYLIRFGKSMMVLLAAFALLAAGIASLLTRQKNLQAQLAEDERVHAQRIRDFADSGADWFWEMNRDFRLRWLSGRTLSRPYASGSDTDSQKSGVQRNVSQASYGYEIDHREWPVRNLNKRTSFHNYEAQWVTRDGEIKTVAVSGKPLFSKSGAFAGYRGIGRDITSRKMIEAELERANLGLIAAQTKGREQAEQALRDSEMFLRTSLNALPEKLAILNQEGIILEANTSWRDFAQMGEVSAGLPEGGGIGWHYKDVFSCKEVTARSALEEVSTMVDSVLHGATNKRRTEVSIFNGAETVWLAIALSSFYSNGNRHCVLAIDEVTDRKRLEEEDRQLRADLAHFSRLTTVGELATGLAHELNQPLTAIINDCDSLLSGVQNNVPLDETDLEAIRAIHSEADRAGAIIKGLRKMVRKETGGMAATDINQLVTETIRLGMPDAKRHGVNVKLNLQSNLPQPEIDAVQIQQVLVNLERNGIDAIKEADPPLREMTISTAEVENDLIQVTVQDTGGGLDVGVREELFNPFLTTKKDGMGMGLSISRSIVESHGGQLWVDFTVLDMTTFHFTLPVNQPNRPLDRA